MDYLTLRPCVDVWQLERLVSPEAEQYMSIAFHYYLQFHLHSQVKDLGMSRSLDTKKLLTFFTDGSHKAS
jgi:hypothetical protein